MKTLIASLVAAGLLIGPASARTLFDDISDSAPRSVFTDIQNTAPRSVFDDLRDTAPKRLFDAIGDQAPRSDGVFGDLERSAP
jgi:hypothetical protein